MAQLMKKLREMVHVGVKRLRAQEVVERFAAAGGKGQSASSAKRATVENVTGAAAVIAGNPGDMQSKRDMAEVKTFLKKMQLLQARLI